MSRPKDTSLYEALGVASTADSAEIRRAYLRKSRSCHPDKVKGKEDEFKRISAAYEILADDEKRAAYDRYGLDESGGINEPGGFPFGGGSGGGGGGAPADIFEMLFGGGGGGAHGHRHRRSGGGGGARRRGQDARYAVAVTLEDLYRGKSEPFKVTRSKACSVCHGEGGRTRGKCTTCDGVGIVMLERRLGASFVQRQQAHCPHCHGSGAKTVGVCAGCKNRKSVDEERELSLHIKPGMRDGYATTFTGEGDDGADVILVLKQTPHARLTRRGNDLYATQSITLYEALTGFVVRLVHLDGRVLQLRSAPHSVLAPGAARVRVDGEGMPVLRQRGAVKGDLYVDFDVVFPRRVDVAAHGPALRAALLDAAEAKDVQRRLDRGAQVDESVDDYELGPGRAKETFGGDDGVDDEDDDDDDAAAGGHGDPFFGARGGAGPGVACAQQ